MIVHGKRIAYSRKLGILPPRERPTYAYLISHSGLVDDFGCLRWALNVVCDGLYPGEDDNYRLRRSVRQFMTHAVGAGLFRLYEANGHVFAQATNWSGVAESKRRIHHSPPTPDHACVSRPRKDGKGDDGCRISGEERRQRWGPSRWVAEDDEAAMSCRGNVVDVQRQRRGRAEGSAEHESNGSTTSEEIRNRTGTPSVPSVPPVNELVEEEERPLRGVPGSAPAPTGPPSSTSLPPAASQTPTVHAQAHEKSDPAAVALAHFKLAYFSLMGFKPDDGVVADAERTLREIGVDARVLNRMRNLLSLAQADDFIADKVRSAGQGLRWVLRDCQGENAARFDAEAAPKRWEQYGSPDGFEEHVRQQERIEADRNAQYEARMRPIRGALDAAIREDSALDGPDDADALLAAAPTFSADPHAQADAARRWASRVSLARMLRRVEAEQRDASAQAATVPTVDMSKLDIDAAFGPAPETPKGKRGGDGADALNWDIGVPRARAN